MKVFITGGSGLIGRHLARRLLDEGDQPVILSRQSDEVRREARVARAAGRPGRPDRRGRWQDAVDGCDAVVNLAGHNLFAERWNARGQAEDPRQPGLLRPNTSSPRSAGPQPAARSSSRRRRSAIYGPHGDEELTEESPSGSDFLAVVCREWEEAAEPAEPSSASAGPSSAPASSWPRAKGPRRS